MSQASPPPLPSSAAATATRTQHTRPKYRQTNGEDEGAERQQNQNQQQQQQAVHTEWTIVGDQPPPESPLRVAHPTDASAEPQPPQQQATSVASVDDNAAPPSEAQLAQHLRTQLARRAVTAAAAAAAPHTNQQQQQTTTADCDQPASLHAEIERLQAELRSARAAMACPAGTATVPQSAVAAAVVAPVPSSPSSAAAPPRHWGSSPRAAQTQTNSQASAPAQRASSARERVRERELHLREHISSSARFYVLMLLHTALALLASAKDTALTRAAMALPGVRDLSMLACDIGVALSDALLHSNFFSMLPCAGWVRDTVGNPALQRAWMAVPDWPEEEVKPWTEGPLRPLFAMLAAMPLATLVFELQPMEGEEHPPESRSEGVRDGPLAAALKRSEALSGDDPAAVLSPKAATATPLSPPSAVQPSAASVSAPTAVGVAAAVVPQPLVHDLFARIEAQQALIALLQQDRAQLHDAVNRLEALATPQQQQQPQDDSSDEQREESDAPASGLRQRRGRSSSARAVELHREKLQSHETAHAHLQAELHAQSQSLLSMREEMKALQQRIWQLEQESLVTRRDQQPQAS